MISIEEAEKKMASSVDHLKGELKNIRTGRANPGIVENIKVEVYGTQMRVAELASISVPEPMQILITPFDLNNCSAVGKAVQEANIGIQPVVEANCVRLRIPPMDREAREKMTKRVSELCEETKVHIRQARKEANEGVKGNKEIPEDERKILEKEIQGLTDKFCKQADDASEQKKTEIMKV